LIDPQREAEEAARIIESDLWKHAFADLDANIVTRLALPDQAPDKIMAAQQELVALRRVKRWLEQRIVTGQMEAMQPRRKPPKSRSLL
jgi:hypothetical protein